MINFVKRDISNINCFQTGTLEQLKETIESLKKRG